MEISKEQLVLLVQEAHEDGHKNGVIMAIDQIIIMLNAYKDKVNSIQDNK